MIELYDYELSGNCFKVRLMLSVLNIEYKSNNVEFYPSEEHKTDDFLKINPLGQLPVISDNGFFLRDAQAILIYLSTKYDKSGSWYPIDDPKKVGMISQWLAFADSITGSASAARLHYTFFYNNFDILYRIFVVVFVL